MMKLSCLPLVFFLVGLEFFAEGEKESTRDLRRGQWQNFGAPVQILKSIPSEPNRLKKIISAGSSEVRCVSGQAPQLVSR
jgi:hypothetical protein